MKKVAIIGTVGVPAKYGGYETLVENLLDKKINAEIQYLVYCSSNVYKEKFHEYKGAKLVYLPLNAMGGNLYYTILFLWCMPFVYVM